MGEKQSSSWAAHFAGIYLRDEIGAVRLEIVPCICFTKVVGFHPYSPLIGLNPVLPGLSLRWEKLHYSCHVSSFLLFLLLYPTLLPSPFRQAKFNTVPLCVQIFNKRFFFSCSFDDCTSNTYAFWDPKPFVGYEVTFPFLSLVSSQSQNRIFYAPDLILGQC